MSWRRIWANLMSRPYLRVVFGAVKDDVKMDIDYNAEFIYHLDRKYANDPVYDRDADDNIKIMRAIRDAIKDEERRDDDPYFVTVIRLTPKKKVHVDSDWNPEFIDYVNDHYQDVSIFPVRADADVKVALFLHDIFSGIAQPHLPQPAPIDETLDDDIPVLSHDDIKQVVDLGVLNRNTGRP